MLGPPKKTKCAKHLPTPGARSWPETSAAALSSIPRSSDDLPEPLIPCSSGCGQSRNPRTKELLAVPTLTEKKRVAVAVFARTEKNVMRKVTDGSATGRRDTASCDPTGHPLLNLGPRFTVGNAKPNRPGIHEGISDDGTNRKSRWIRAVELPLLMSLRAQRGGPGSGTPRKMPRPVLGSINTKTKGTCIAMRMKKCDGSILAIRMGTFAMPKHLLARMKMFVTDGALTGNLFWRPYHKIDWLWRGFENITNRSPLVVREVARESKPLLKRERLIAKNSIVMVVVDANKFFPICQLTVRRLKIKSA